MTTTDNMGVVTGSPETQAEEILESADGRRLVVLLDYDGTLSPIAPRPEDAVLSAATRATLQALAARWPTAVVSGRSLDDVRDRVALEQLFYAGNHGLEIEGPEGSGIRRSLAEDFVPDVAETVLELQRALAPIEGSLVEDKHYSISVHYRLVATEQIALVEAAVDESIARHPRLEKRHGKKVFELRPALAWDKGKAVLWLMETIDENGTTMLPIYVGDDVTDEDAFRALADVGIGVLVSEEPRRTAASYRLGDTEETRRFLARLAAGPES
jgi:trehalose-phosphatase